MDARGRGRRGSDVEGANDDARVGRRRRGGRERGGEDSIWAIRRAPSARAGARPRPGRGRRARGRASSARARGVARGDVRVRHPRVFPRVSGSIGATARGRARRARRGVADPEDEGGCRREIQIWLVRDCGRQRHSPHRAPRASHEPTRGKSTRAPSRARSGRTRSARARTPGGFERAPLQSSASSPPSGRARAGRAPGVVARGRPEATRRSLPRRAFLGNARSRDDVRGSPPPPVDPRHAARLRSSPDGVARVARLALEPRARGRGRGRGRGRRRRRRRSTRSAANDPGASVPATGPAPDHRFGRPTSSATAIGARGPSRAPAIFCFFSLRARRPPLRARSLPLPSPAPSLTPQSPPPLFPSSRDFSRRGRGDPRGVRARPRRPRAPAPPGHGGEAAPEAVARAAAPFQPFRSNARHPGAIIVADPVPLRPGIRGRVPAGGRRSERAPRPRGGSLLGSVGLFRFPSLGKSAAAFRRRRFFAPLRRSPQPLRVLGGIVLPSPLSALQRERRLQ